MCKRRIAVLQRITIATGVEYSRSSQDDGHANVCTVKHCCGRYRFQESCKITQQTISVIGAHLQPIGKSTWTDENISLIGSSALVCASATAAAP